MVLLSRVCGGCGRNGPGVPSVPTGDAPTRAMTAAAAEGWWDDRCPVCLLRDQLARDDPAPGVLRNGRGDILGIFPPRSARWLRSQL